ncbi:MAG: hypothetical protein H0S85_07720 [Desulfovibrionaceae bacterium]|jgi:hypothetical protein|nr:hypothetical protein [Desulfovibrionaceae bacterium]
MSDEPDRNIDLVEMPLEGLAAYWLSLKKLVGKRNIKALAEEAEYTPEPFVRYLLEACLSNLDAERFAAAAQARRQTCLDGLAVRLDLMRMALLDIAVAENPRKTLAKMTAQFDRTPLTEQEAFRLAQELAKVPADPKADHSVYFNVDHHIKPDQLMVTLLFYVMLARREGREACQGYFRFVNSSFFVDGLSLVIDGFDAPLVRKRMRVHRDAILAAVGRKADLSICMCRALRDRLEYEDMFTLAKAWMA